MCRRRVSSCRLQLVESRSGGRSSQGGKGTDTKRRIIGDVENDATEYARSEATLVLVQLNGRARDWQESVHQAATWFAMGGKYVPRIRSLSIASALIATPYFCQPINNERA